MTLVAKSMTLSLFLVLAIMSCNDEPRSNPENKPESDLSSKAELGNNGYAGYLGYQSTKNPSYGMGVSFYTAAWKLIEDPLANFQIGLPGTWIIPDNSDNNSLALCPVGTLAREWPERGPTWGSVFQTLEGGLGYWARNKYRYGPAKFMMNSTPTCYDVEIATPGWSFFYDDKALDDDMLGIAQLSNRILIPPDALTFEGNPDGEFMGYSYMALPFTRPYKNSKVSIGDQSWTCFINTENFKGPIAYYLPETWAKLSERYPEIEGRGLDNRQGIINGGAMEINTVQHYEAKSATGDIYVKVPKLNFPTDESGKAALVQDLRFYNKSALFNDILDWRDNQILSTGEFKNEGTFRPTMSANNPFLDVLDLDIKNLDDVFKPYVDKNVFGLTWEDTKFETGSFPEYFKKNGDEMVPITASEVPRETDLIEATFPNQENKGTYFTNNAGSWTRPGPTNGPYTAALNDGSTVTYYWFKFIDQPVFGQFSWTDEKRAALQSLIEQIHAEWTIDQSYIPEPSFGNLVSLDENLIVTPPEGLEYGYVPVVVRQE